MTYRETIKKLENAALDPGKTILNSVAATGKEAFGCFPIYTPEEIIYAAGMLPVGIWGGNTELKMADKYLQSFCCSIMRSNIEYGIKGTYSMLKGVIIPTFCDTLKCICENWKVAVPGIPVVPVVYPQNRSLDAGFVYLIDEFDRVKTEIEKITGKEVNSRTLNDTWDLYEEYRSTMRKFVKTASSHPDLISSRTRHLIIKAGYFMDKKTYTEDIKTIIEGLDSEKETEFKGKRVVATGLLSEPVEILNILDESGIAVVSDDLAHESRQFRTKGRDSGSVWEKMAYRMKDQRGDTFLFEAQKRRGEVLKKLTEEYNADAVVIFMMKFCDPEEFDYPIYKKELENAGIPMLYLEVEQQMDSFEQIRTRIQSFAEMLI